ncbi:MAG TPA: DUF4019 domain-containing protein [Acidobacteriaceae bacterium]|nr:DUF4019 domain-containing protein [Acidobacteriaceae bacterium]
MRRTATLALLTILLAASALVAQQTQLKDHTEAKKTALQSATAWLKLVDNENYDASWRSTSKEFQGSVSQKKWSQMAQAVRSPLGALNSRQLRDSTYTTSVPGAPDGQYVILHFATSFANKKSATETVAMMLQNGQWRVSGYFIK